MSRIGMFTRHKFIKKLYPNYLVIIEIKEFLNNNHYRYIKVSYLNMVLIKIKDRLKHG